MGVWFAKFFSGFTFWKGAFWGKIIYFGVVFFVFMGIYSKLTSPTTKQIIKSDTTIVEASKDKTAFIGIQLWRFWIGVSIEQTRPGSGKARFLDK